MAAYLEEPPRPQRALGVSPYQEWTGDGLVIGAQFFRLIEGYLVRFPDLADFEISLSGERIRSWPVPGAPAAAIRHLYLNQVVPLASSRSGRLMFHASAVAIGASCVAFMGPSGRGKSTLAATFAASGHAFLTDDGLSVRIVEGRRMVMPSHPSIRLWPDSQDAILEILESPATDVADSGKARFLAGPSLSFRDRPLPLERIYLLGDDSASAISFEALGPGQALIELVRHSFLLDIEHKDALASHFDELAALLARPALCFRLDYPRNFDQLAAVRKSIIEQSAQTSRASAGK